MNGTEDLTSYLWLQELGYVRKGMSWEERKACYALKDDIYNEMVEAGYDITYLNEGSLSTLSAWGMCLLDYQYLGEWYNPANAWG